MDKDNKTLACLGIWIYLFILMIGGPIIHGWALKILWSWFIVPLFGLPELTITFAIGISLIVGMFKNTTANNQSKNKDWVEIIGEGFGAAFIAPLLFVGVGWIVTLFL